MDSNKKGINIKIILKVVTLLLMVMFFVPLFTVSCQGHKFDFSAARLSMGYTYNGREIVKPYIVCGLLLIIPVVVFVISIIIKNNRILGLISTVSGLIDITLLIIIIQKAKSKAEDNFLYLNVGFGFYLNLLLNLVLIILSIFIIIGESQKIPILNSYSTAPRVCPNCGSYLEPGDIYCGECGTKYEMSVNVYSQKRFCTNCGKELGAGDSYCTNCGNKVE